MIKNISHRSSGPHFPTTSHLPFIPTAKASLFSAFAILPSLLRSKEDSTLRKWALRLCPIFGVGALLLSRDSDKKTVGKISLVALISLGISEWKSSRPSLEPIFMASKPAKISDSDILTFVSSQRAFKHVQDNLHSMLNLLETLVKQLQQAGAQELLNIYEPKLLTLKTYETNIQMFCPALAFGIISFSHVDKEIGQFQSLQIRIFKNWVRISQGKEEKDVTLLADLQAFCESAKHSCFHTLKGMLAKATKKPEDGPGFTSLSQIFDSIMDLDMPEKEERALKADPTQEVVVRHYYRERECLYDGAFSPHAMERLFDNIVYGIQIGATS